MPLKNLPEVNRTKINLWDQLIQTEIQKSFENFVTEGLKAKQMAEKIGQPPLMLRKAIEINGQLYDALVEERGVRNVENIADLVNRTFPLLHFPVKKQRNESLVKIFSIFTDYKLLPITSRLGLSTLNAYSSYQHGLLGTRSLVVGNFVDATFHYTLATYSAYRTAFQLLNVNNTLNTTDLLWETVSLTVSANLIRVKNFFTKGKELKHGLEAASVLLTFKFSKRDNIEPNIVSETLTISYDTNLEFQEGLEALLQVLMVDD